MQAFVSGANYFARYGAAPRSAATIVTTDLGHRLLAGVEHTAGLVSDLEVVAGSQHKCVAPCPRVTDIGIVLHRGVMSRVNEDSEVA